MSEPKLKPSIWIKALLRTCDVQSVPAAIVRKGDPDAGDALIKLNRFEHGCTVYVQQRINEGELAWAQATGPVPVKEAEAEAYIARAIARDPDIWVVEIEDQQGRQFFPGRII